MPILSTLEPDALLNKPKPTTPPVLQQGVSGPTSSSLNTPTSPLPATTMQSAPTGAQLEPEARLNKPIILVPTVEPVVKPPPVYKPPDRIVKTVEPVAPMPTPSPVTPTGARLEPDAYIHPTDYGGETKTSIQLEQIPAPEPELTVVPKPTSVPYIPPYIGKNQIPSFTESVDKGVNDFLGMVRDIPNIVGQAHPDWKKAADEGNIYAQGLFGLATVTGRLGAGVIGGASSIFRPWTWIPGIIDTGKKIATGEIVKDVQEDPLLLAEMGGSFMGGFLTGKALGYGFTKIVKGKEIGEASLAGKSIRLDMPGDDFVAAHQFKSASPEATSLASRSSSTLSNVPKSSGSYAKIASEIQMVERSGQVTVLESGLVKPITVSQVASEVLQKASSVKQLPSTVGTFTGGVSSVVSTSSRFLDFGFQQTAPPKTIKPLYQPRIVEDYEYLPPGYGSTEPPKPPSSKISSRLVSNELNIVPQSSFMTRIIPEPYITRPKTDAFTKTPSFQKTEIKPITFTVPTYIPSIRANLLPSSLSSLIPSSATLQNPRQKIFMPTLSVPLAKTKQVSEPQFKIRSPKPEKKWNKHYMGGWFPREYPILLPEQVLKSQGRKRFGS